MGNFGVFWDICPIADFAIHRLRIEQSSRTADRQRAGVFRCLRILSSKINGGATRKCAAARMRLSMEPQLRARFIESFFRQADISYMARYPNISVKRSAPVVQNPFRTVFISSSGESPRFLTSNYPPVGYLPAVPVDGAFAERSGCVARKGRQRSVFPRFITPFGRPTTAFSIELGP